MSRIAGALAISRKDIESYYGKPPLVTWGLLFPAVLILAVYIKDRAGYLDVAPGIIGMTLLFGNTSMAAIVITFEKRTGTLERLLLAPLSARTIVLGKALSAAAYGIATSLVLTLGLVAFLDMPLARPGVFTAGILLGAGIFSFLGIVASVLVREVFEAMTLMNFFRFPLLFISGVFLPVGGMPWWIKPVAYLSPLTHVVELLRCGVQGDSALGPAWVPASIAIFFLLMAAGVTVPSFRRCANR
jgi:ABC-2 type transport system permease protein